MKIAPAATDSPIDPTVRASVSVSAWLMRRAIFDRVTLTKNSGVICLEMMKKIQDAGFAIAEAPVHHSHRAYGKSQFFNVGRIARTAADVLKLWWLLVVRRGAAPGAAGRQGA